MAQRQETLEELLVADAWMALHAVPSGEAQRVDRRARPLHQRGRARRQHHGLHRRARARHRRSSPRVQAQAQVPIRVQAQAAVPVYVERMSLWKSTLLSLVSLAFVLGIAVGVMEGMGQLLHVLHPARHFDIFYAFHKEIVVASLAAVCLLWLIPPHPWTKRLVEVPDQDAPAPRSSEAGRATVTVLSPRGGRHAARGPIEAQGVGG